MTAISLRIELDFDKKANGWCWYLYDVCCNNVVVASHGFYTGFNGYHDAWVAAQKAQADAFRGH